MIAIIKMRVKWNFVTLSHRLLNKKTCVEIVLKLPENYILKQEVVWQSIRFFFWLKSRKRRKNDDKDKIDADFMCVCVRMSDISWRFVTRHHFLSKRIKLLHIFGQKKYPNQIYNNVKSCYTKTTPFLYFKIQLYGHA